MTGIELVTSSYFVFLTLCLMYFVPTIYAKWLFVGIILTLRGFGNLRRNSYILFSVNVVTDKVGISFMEKPIP